MKTKKIYMLIIAAALLAMSCGKTCRCYRYDGNVDEFDMSQLEEEETSCANLS